MDTTTADPTRVQFGVRYRDRNGRTRERYFSTEAGLQRFLDNGGETGAVSAVLAFTDPQPTAGAQS